MRAEGSIWVGAIDLSGDAAVTAVSGEPRADQAGARVLVRMHGAPIGYVSIPLRPAQTIAGRARAAAETVLAGPLRRHLYWDGVAAQAVGPPPWAASVTCPRYFPAPDGTGVSVVVCSRDRVVSLGECLRALRRVTYAPLEILVVDNAPSSDATRRIVSEFARHDARFRYACEPSPGLSRARNHGMAQAKYDLVAFSDDDVIVDPGWPAALAAGLAADPEAVCVTGPVASRSLDTGAERYFDSRYAWGEILEPRRYDLGTHRDASRLYPFSAGIFGTAANLAVRRAVVDRLGGFDPLLGAGGPCRGGEDLDMFLRMILAGGRICCLPSALAWHRHRADSGALAGQIYAYGQGLGAYLAKRLMRREIPAAMLVPGLGRSAEIAGRMRRATHASQLRTRGRGLAVSEAWGVVAGAHCYYRAARQTRGR
jgi:GT2 family glycosyltransferase